MSMSMERLEEALAKEEATNVQLRARIAELEAQQQEPEYAWPTVADYEIDVGFQTNEAFRMAWNMARTTNRMLGHASSQPAQQNIRNATLDEIVLFIENYVEGYDYNYRELGLELAAEIQARKT